LALWTQASERKNAAAERSPALNVARTSYLVRYRLECGGMRMIPKRILIFAFTTAVVMAMVSDARPQDADRGQIEFLLNCSGCHGTDAKGSGPQSAKLHMKPVDLTVLAKQNHGRFDPGAVYQMIDGRNARLSHHVWGCRHQSPLPTLPTTTKRKQKIPKRILSQMKPHKNELDSLLDLPCDSEAVIRERLLAIVSYLSLVQER
jgi:cytochrome c553